MKKYDSFCVESRKNGVPESASKDAYPLHKIFAENKNSTTRGNVHPPLKGK